MRYYKLYKSRKKQTCSAPIKLEGGFTFSSKYKISIYSYDLLNNVLLTKINKQLKKLIKLYMYEEESDDGDTSSVLEPLESLKIQFFRDYYPFLTRDNILICMNRIGKLEKKCLNNAKRNRHM